MDKILPDGKCRPQGKIDTRSRRLAETAGQTAPSGALDAFFRSSNTARHHGCRHGALQPLFVQLSPLFPLMECFMDAGGMKRPERGRIANAPPQRSPQGVELGSARHGRRHGDDAGLISPGGHVYGSHCLCPLHRLFRKSGRGDASRCYSLCAGDRAPTDVAPAFKAFFRRPGRPKPFVTRRTDRVLRCRKDPDIPTRRHPIAPHLIGAGVSFVLFLIGGLRHDYGSRFKKQRRLYGAQR